MDGLSPARFLESLHRLRAFGASGEGKGVVRPAFSQADTDARLWLLDQFAEAGLRPELDAVGNVFALHPADKSLLIGSHTDSQPEGGWLDGALGVMAGLEIARAALATGGPPVSVVSFQDEEGRFGGLGGSEVWAGSLDLKQADERLDQDGVAFGDARKILQPHVTGPVDPANFTGFLEMHIEQGPELERAGKTIGVITDIVGFRQMDITLTGRQNHAGTTRMASRQDAVQGMMALNAAMNAKLPELVTDLTVWTIGQIHVHPNAASIVPGEATFSFQWRDASQARLDQIEKLLRAEVARMCQQFRLTSKLEMSGKIAPVPVDAALKARLCKSAEKGAAGKWCAMPSGALHDASNVSVLMPMAMLFVPSIGGISHAFDEDTSEDDLVTGLKVLASAAVQK